jgi:cardiolipin synthase
MPDLPASAGRPAQTGPSPQPLDNHIEFLVDAEQFLPRFRQDVLGAHKRIYVQTLSLEGDSAGQLLADLFLQAGVPDRKIIVDDFTNWVLSDRYLFWPGSLLNREIRRERRSTAELFRTLRSGQVGLKFVNPILSPKFLARNHKKLAVVDDDIAYVGGLNFSEHNFDWHDVMVRIQHPGVARMLAQDFQATWSGRPTFSSAHFEDLTLDLLNGTANQAAFATISERIRLARQRIVVISPYLTFPIADELMQARRRGVSVIVITPAANNWRLVQNWIMWHSWRAEFDIRLYPGMSHLKAMLIDDDQLIVGSSNFDFLSYRVFHELVVTVRSRPAIQAFKAAVLEPDLASSRPMARRPNGLTGHIVNARLRFTDRLVSWWP